MTANAAAKLFLFEQQINRRFLDIDISSFTSAIRVETEDRTRSRLKDDLVDELRDKLPYVLIPEFRLLVCNRLKLAVEGGKLAAHVLEVHVQHILIGHNYISCYGNYRLSSHCYEYWEGLYGLCTSQSRI